MPKMSVKRYFVILVSFGAVVFGGFGFGRCHFSVIWLSLFCRSFVVVLPFVCRFCCRVFSVVFLLLVFALVAGLRRLFECSLSSNDDSNVRA